MQRHWRLVRPASPPPTNAWATLGRGRMRMAHRQPLMLMELLGSARSLSPRPGHRPAVLGKNVDPEIDTTCQRVLTGNGSPA